MARTKLALLLTAAVLTAACDDARQPLATDAERGRPTVAPGDAVGAVFLSSNATTSNDILVFGRAADGTLTPAAPVPTGGLGTGAGLGNQLALVLTDDGRRLFVVNAGSDDISAFQVRGTDLAPIGAPTPSGGRLPLSLTVHGDLLYVLNGGSPANVTGFRIATDGSLAPIPQSTQPLSAAAPGPAQIEFTPAGNVLVVTEKNTNTITTYVVGADGRAGPPHAQPSIGHTPFGFNFNKRGDLVVSEAGGTGTGASTASSYRVGTDGSLTPVSSAVATTQLAACWIAIGPNGLHAYTTNTGSGTVSRLGIAAGASLSLEDAVAGVTGAGSQPQDADFSAGGRFLYVRNAAGSVSAFSVAGDGALSPVGVYAPIPTSASGIAAS